MQKRAFAAALLMMFSAGAAMAQFTRTEDLRVRPPEAWKPHEVYGLDLSLGGSYLSGNVRSRGFSGALEFDYKPAERHSFFVQASDNYVKYGKTAVTDKSRGSLLYAYAVHPRWNLYFQSTHSRDKFRSVEYRMTNTLGVCHHNFLPGVLKPLMISAGVTPEYEEESSGSVRRDLRGTARLNFAAQLTETVKLNGDFIYSPRLSDTGDSQFYSEGYLELKVWKEAVAYRITATSEYDTRPAPGVKRADFGLVHALVVKFAK